MKTEAAAGFYESKVWGKQYPRLQLRTAGELLEGQAVERPPTRELDEALKRTPRAKLTAEAHPELEL